MSTAFGRFAAFIPLTGALMFLPSSFAAAASAPQSACRAVARGPQSPDGTLVKCDGASGLAPYYLHRPAGDVEGAPVIVAVHGISRNAREQARAFGSHAARQGFVTVAPHFSPTRFPAYQRLGRCRHGPRAAPDLALAGILDHVRASTGADTSRVFLFGFSGGAQFAHRFALCSPGRVKAMVLGSAGWYTFPDTSEPFPRGIGRAPLAQGWDLAGMLRVPTLVVVGDRDTHRDGAFNTSPRLDTQQGRNRIERGARWAAAMQQAADRAGLGPRFSFATLPGCGHSFAQCAAEGGLVPAALEFFLTATRRMPLGPPDANLPPSHLLFSARTAD